MRRRCHQGNDRERDGHRTLSTGPT